VKRFLGLKDLTREELTSLLDGAAGFVDWSGSLLDGVTVGALFFERSTRTRLSFEMAANRLGARTLTFFPEQSSMGKGETLQDTVMTVAAIGVQILVVRHQENGVPEWVHVLTGKPVINAGDGSNEHPTQGLADILTIRQRFGAVEGISVAVVGDIVHSRVAGSLLPALSTLGASVTLVGPADMVPEGREDVVAATDDLDMVVGEVDVVYLLRVQSERGANIGADYSARYQMSPARAAGMRSGAVVMHPGPMNRGVEIADEVADGPRSLVQQQVANGVPVRMAVLAAVGEGLR
jgi:aspartate carbamoyltransferase catalytic subunit